MEAKDVTKFISIYDPDVVVFDMWENWEYQERDAWKMMVIEWFDSLGSNKVTVIIKDVNIIPDQHIAGLHPYFTFSGLSASGEVMHSMDNRFTWI